MKLVKIRGRATHGRSAAAALVALALLLGQAMHPAAASALEILRDPWGTPHVFAVSEADGFFGLGYAAAEDRLLQMELIRRKAAGRLAEVFGPDWVDADREEYHRFHELVAQVGDAEALRRSGPVIDDLAAIVSEAAMAKDAAVLLRIPPRRRAHRRARAGRSRLSRTVHWLEPSYRLGRLGPGCGCARDVPRPAHRRRPGLCLRGPVCAFRAPA